jgi:hypothetical protein
MLEWNGTVAARGQEQSLQEVIAQQSDRRFTAVYYSPGSDEQQWIADTRKCEKQLSA